MQQSGWCLSCLGVCISFCYNILAAFLRAAGDSRTPLIAVSLAAVCNMVLDFLFVVILHLGVFGAAFATLLSQMLSAVCCLRAVRTGGLFLAFVSALYCAGLCAGHGKYGTAHVLQLSAAIHAGRMCLFSDEKDWSDRCILGRNQCVAFGGCVFVPVSAVGIPAAGYDTGGTAAKHFTCDTPHKGNLFKIMIAKKRKILIKLK